MTLMTFLRDYLFHPLANARFGRGHRLLQYFAALIITMALCGLWHGPSWTFVLWGTAQGVAVVTVSLWRRYGWRMPSLAGWAITMVFSLLLGVVFRAGSLEATWNVYQGLAILPDFGAVGRAFPIIVAGVIACTLPASQDIAAWLNERPRKAVAAALALVVVAILVELGDREAYEFVYFQF
jgi:hypothetical protein